MEIKDLKPKQGSVEITAEVTEKEEPREFEKFGKSGKVCNAKIKDSTGEMKLTLWNEQIDQVNVGDTVHIVNGYVNEWQGEMQLTTGKFGTLEVVGKEELSEKPLQEEMKTDEGSHILTKDEATEEETLDETGKKAPTPEQSVTDDEETESEMGNDVSEISIEEEKVE